MHMHNGPLGQYTNLLRPTFSETR